jgi:hypothetical protein
MSEDGQQKRKNPIFWKKAWVHAFDSDERLNHRDYWQESYRLIQNEGRGLLMQGTREWADYQLVATANPRLCKTGGIAVRVQGIQRYYGLLLDQNKVRLVRVLDGETVLAEADGGWTLEQPCDLKLQVEGAKLIGYVNGQQVIEAEDDALQSGAIALICEEGFIYFDHVAVSPL